MIVESYEDIVILSGALAANYWDTLHTAIALKLRKYPQGVIIDCSQLTEVSPRGVETFRSVMEYIERHDARVIVAAVPQHVREVMNSVPDVRSQLPVVNSVEEARRSLYLIDEPEHDEPSNKKKKRQAESKPPMLAVLAGNDSDRWLMKTSSEFAAAHDLSVIYLYPIIVPRDQPINAPLAEAEELAKSTLMQGKTTCENLDIQSLYKIERARDIASAIEDQLEENPVRVVMIAFPDDPEQLDIAAKLVKSVLAKVKAPIHFIRGPILD